MNSLRQNLLLTSLLCITLQPCVTMGQTIGDQAVDSATTVLDEIMSVPAKQIPQSLLADARCVAIIPNVVKGGFIVGVRHGRGVVLVRDDAGNWHPPMFASLTGGSVGWQAGIQSTDVVLIFRTRRSVNGLMNGKVTIGVDAAVAAGPVGRQAAAATDARLGAEILSYSRSRGLFAGVSIDGSILQLDHLAGSVYYGTPIVGANGEAIRSLDSVPASAIRLMNRLSLYTESPRIVAAAAAPIPNPSATAKASETRQSESVRRQLVSSWQKLSARLDDRWKEYLAPPRDVLAGQPADTTTLRNKLQQYTLVASDRRYAALAESAEFAATHQLFREYVTLQATQSTTTLTLPPPPGRRY
ncbi:MAG: lipid-binding SYLF domain-containing protein [Pirellulaceae bacterium]